MARKSLSQQQVIELLGDISCSDSEGEIFSSEEEFIPNVETSDSDEDFENEEAHNCRGNVAVNISSTEQVLSSQQGV